MTRISTFALLLAAGLGGPAWAGEGVMLKDDTLRATSSAAAAAVGRAAKGAKVEILARQGGWTQVRATGKTGWVRLLSVRGASSGGSGSLADVAALTEKRDPNKVVATAGLRGLSEEDLRQAQYDAAQMRQLEGQAASPEEARRFAAEGKLAGQKLNYLPAPVTKAKETKPTPPGGFEL